MKDYLVINVKKLPVLIVIVTLLVISDLRTHFEL